MPFDKDSILIDAKSEAERIIKELREIVAKKIHKRGAVVGVSGGIDSSVVLALCAEAFGPNKVLALMMPDKDSSPDSLNLAKKLVDKFKVPYLVEDITEAVKGFGAYKRRDEAVRKIFPEYNDSYKMKIVLPKDDEAKGRLNVYYVTIISPAGEEKTARLPLKEYLQIVAASNFKQRSRTNFLYYHAEARNYAVIGTGNKNEHEQGFFVKYGDGGADIKPIAHLFKTQVYQLAEYLGVPEKIRRRTPTTDTYSAEQTQEEFFFRLPYSVLDRIWFGWEKGYSADEIAEEMQMTTSQVQVVINDIKQKIQSTEYLRMEPISLG
uniref:NH(3)-dependent NAD(+) synthetase n=1 Tax=Ignavibacterium album TaxID=591197 RepID=A0A7V2ZIJ1_9BACT